MSPEISERAFEEAIECALLRHGPDACPGDETAVRESGPAYGEDPAPGGYLRRRSEDYDRGLCLIPGDVVDFLLATQPKEWERLRQHHGSEVKARFLGRLSREICPAGGARRAPQRREGHGLPVPDGLLPARERAEPGTAAPARGQPLRRGAPTALQRARRAQPRPRNLPERHPHLHGRAQESSQRPGCGGRHPAVPARPRPQGASLCLRALPGPLRRRPGTGVRDHPVGRARHPISAL